MIKDIKQYCDLIFNKNTDKEFLELVRFAYKYQYNNNDIYKKFCNLIGVKSNYKINALTDVPFLPIDVFKTNKIVSTSKEPEILFKSSGTTSEEKSIHYLADKSLYDKSIIYNYNYFFDDIKDTTILALLPSYLQQKNSSLIYMVKKLMEVSGSTDSGFYLNNFDELSEKIISLEKQKKEYLLLGVSYALLDFGKYYNSKIEYGKIMETGGMKGRKKEITRKELHSLLCNYFSVSDIMSEYGMTELLSQAYSLKDGIFYCPPQMKVLLRDSTDPFNIFTKGKACLNIIDLANIYSCCFIASSDLAEIRDDLTSFKISGRYDMSDVRGCNLLYFTEE